MELLEVLYGKEYLQICKNITKGADGYEDLRSEVALQIYDKPPKNLDHLLKSGQIKFYFSRCAHLQWNGNRTAFQKKFATSKEYASDEIPDQAMEVYEAPEKLELIEKFIKIYTDYVNNHYNLFERELFRLWVTTKSAQKIANDTGIAVHRVREYVKNYDKLLRSFVLQATRPKAVKKQYVQLLIPFNGFGFEPVIDCIKPTKAKHKRNPTAKTLVSKDKKRYPNPLFDINSMLPKAYKAEIQRYLMA